MKRFALIALVVLLPSAALACCRHHHHGHHHVAPAPVVPFFSFFMPFGNDATAMQAKVTAAAFTAGVPNNVAHAVIRTESGFNPGARSRSGAIGLGQILCSTARGIGFSGSCAQLRDPDVNLRYSMAYLRMAIDRGGNSCAGISLYNRGIAAPPVCTGYGRIVLARADGGNVRAVHHHHRWAPLE